MKSILDNLYALIRWQVLIYTDIKPNQWHIWTLPGQKMFTELYLY